MTTPKPKAKRGTSALGPAFVADAIAEMILDAEPDADTAAELAAAEARSSVYEDANAGANKLLARVPADQRDKFVEVFSVLCPTLPKWLDLSGTLYPKSPDAERVYDSLYAAGAGVPDTAADSEPPIPAISPRLLEERPSMMAGNTIEIDRSGARR